MSQMSDIAQQGIQAIQQAAQAAKDKYDSAGNSIGSWFGLGDDGTQEKSAIDTIQRNVLPVLQREAANADSWQQADVDKFNDLANTAITSLKEIGAWSDDSNFFTAVQYTASQSVQQVANAAKDAFDFWGTYGGKIMWGAAGLAALVAAYLVYSKAKAVGSLL